jgi:hypothetical protein
MHRLQSIVLLFGLVAAIVVPVIPAAFAHGGMQPPAADFGDKKASLSLKVDPPVITDTSQPILITARFFDEKTNENFKEVTYRIFFEKDGNEIPIQTEGGGFYGGQGLFYDPQGDLEIKIIPKDTPVATARGVEEIQYGGIWNMGAPVNVEGPIFTEPGLYNLFVEIHPVGTTRTQVEPILKYDIWVTPGREEGFDAGNGQQIRVRNYYGAIDDFSYSSETDTIQFSMPYNWSSDLVTRIGMLHAEVFIPKSIAEFNKHTLNGTVNGISVPIAVDYYSPDYTIVHLTISRSNLENIAGRVLADNINAKSAVFTLRPPTVDGKIINVETTSENYRAALAWPEQVFPGQPVTFGIRIADSSGSPISVATYELVIVDNSGNEIIRAGGVTTPEGISSQDVNFASTGSFTVSLEKINSSGESIKSSIMVVPEFPAGIAMIGTAIAASVILGMTMKLKRVF